MQGAKPFGSLSGSETSLITSDAATNKGLYSVFVRDKTCNCGLFQTPSMVIMTNFELILKAITFSNAVQLTLNPASLD